MVLAYGPGSSPFGHRLGTVTPGAYRECMAANEAFISCDELPGDTWVRVTLPDGPGPYEVDCPFCGQTVVIAESACVAVEAMEGTDATIERAGQIMRSMHGDAFTLSRDLTVVKIAKPNQDMRFDVPVIGVKTIEVMRQAGASCLALDAGRCLLLEREAIIAAADIGSLSVIAD